MDLRAYISQMGPSDLASYADRCGISQSYLRMHVKYASKDPSVSLIKSLARQSQGQVSLAEVLVHFGIVDTDNVQQHKKRRPKGRPVPPNTHHHSAVGTR